MRIVYTHRTQGIGAEGVHIQGMVEALRDLGNDVVVDCLPGCDPSRPAQEPATSERPPRHAAPRSGRSIVQRICRLVAGHAPQSLFGVIELLYNIPLAFRLGGRLRARPDMVYERYAVGNFAPALLCRAGRIPLVLEVNDSVVIERSRPTTFPRIKRGLERRILAAADLVITVTQHFKDQLLASHATLRESQILVLPNAVSERRFNAPTFHEKARDELRASLGLGTRALVGTTGQFLPWHGLAELVTAAAPLARQLDLGFLFVGDGPARLDVLEAARAAGVADRVKFTGMLPPARVPEHLALLSVAVIPASNSHCSPMKLIEFMAMGLPVVAPDLPNIREVVEDQRTGRLFHPGDLAAMCRCLRDLLDDPTARRALGQQARSHVAANLTWAEHARKVLATLSRKQAQVGGHPCIS